MTPINKKIFNMKRIIISALVLLTSASAMAQSTGELLKFSRYDFSNATARSTAMGGAFTSLGADMASMSINPAGLAMYSSNEASMSFGMNINKTNSDYGGMNFNSESRGKFIVPSVGTVLKLGNFVLGFGYNRLADFNSQMAVDGNYEQFNSISRQWADQLQGVPHTALDVNNPMANQNPLMWNAIMGYESFLIDPVRGTSDRYGLWYQDGGNTFSIIDPTDMIASQIKMSTNGAIDEVVLSGAYNFKDKFYFGATLGFQSIVYTQSSTYAEFTDRDVAYGDFDEMYLDNWMAMSGFGFNIKVGATYRPIPWLRIGVAYHSPTWISMNEESASSMDAFYHNQIQSDYSYTPDLVQDYNMSTPGRLMAGVSATLFNRMIVSFDYELTSYKDMRYDTDINTYGWRPSTLTNDIDNLPNYAGYTSNYGDIAMNDIVADNYSSTNNYRVGIEVTPATGLFLRAGFAYSDSPYADKESFYDPTTKLSDYGSITRWSGGIGFRTGRFYFDAAYVYSATKLLPNSFFDYITGSDYDTGYNEVGTNKPWVIPAGQSIISEQNINQTNFSHNVIITASVRF